MSAVGAAEGRNDCVQEAIRGGAWAGVTALVAAGLSIGLANQFWPAFRNSLGVSGKTALVVSSLSILTRHRGLKTESWSVQKHYLVIWNPCQSIISSSHCCHVHRPCHCHCHDYRWCLHHQYPCHCYEYCYCLCNPHDDNDGPAHP